MFIRNLKDCAEFISGDGALLRELLNARKGHRRFGYSLAHAVLKPHRATRPHRLKSSEVYYLMKGRGRMHIDGGAAEVGPGDTVYIPPHSVQYIENTGRTDLVFLCIVDPAWQPEDEEIL